MESEYVVKMRTETLETCLRLLFGFRKIRLLESILTVLNDGKVRLETVPTGSKISTGTPGRARFMFYLYERVYFRF